MRITRIHILAIETKPVMDSILFLYGWMESWRNAWFIYAVFFSFL